MFIKDSENNIVDFKNEDDILKTNFCILAINEKLSNDFIIKYKFNFGVNKTYDPIESTSYECRGGMGNKILEEYRSGFYFLSLKQNIDYKVMEELSKYLDWDILTSKHIKNDNFIEKFQDFVNWEFITNHKILNKYFLKKFENKIQWEYILENNNFLKQELIEFFANKLDKYQWEEISSKVGYGDIILTDNFKKEYSHKLDSCLMKPKKHCKYCGEWCEC